MSTSQDYEERQTAAEAAEALKEKAGEAKDILASRIKTTAHDQKVVISDEMAKFSQAIRRAADELRDEQRVTAADYTSDLANVLNDWADTLRETDFQQVMASVHRSARHHPIAFMGGAVLAGLAAGRLLRVAADDSEVTSHQGETAQRPADR